MEPIEEEEVRRTSRGRAVVYACVASLGAVAFGYSLGFSSPSLPAMQGSVFHRVQCDDDSSTSSATGSLWSSIVNIGAMVGAVWGGRMLENVGRKGSLVWCAAPLLVVGWAGTALAENFVEILAARLVVGAGVGLCSAAVPVYITETSPPDLRGGLGSVNQLAVTLGIFGVYLVGFLLPHSRREYNCGAHAKSIHPSGWRLLAWVGAGIGAAVGLGVSMIPESPAFLAKRGRSAAAKEATVRDLVDMLVPAAWASPTVDKACRIPLRISLTLMQIQQFSGINAVIFYSGDILGTAGMTDRDLGGVIVMAIQVMCTALSVPLVDRLGRRTLLIFSLSGMTLASCLLALYFVVSAPGFLALISLVIYIASFSLGLGPLPWLLMAELLPTRARGLAASTATMLNWLCSFVITETFAYLILILRPAGTFFVFAGVTFLGILYVAANLPETKGASLDDIDRLFAQRLADSSPSSNLAVEPLLVAATA